MCLRERERESVWMHSSVVVFMAGPGSQRVSIGGGAGGNSRVKNCVPIHCVNEV